MHHVHTLDTSDAAQIRRCFPVFSVLRPHLDEAELVRRVQRQVAERYKIVFIEMDGDIVAAAGYRIAHFLWAGKTLYIDDLITSPAKTKQGLGGALLDWLIAEARRQGCDEVHLDTGYQRHDAHRLYLNKGFTFSAHHVSLRLAR